MCSSQPFHFPLSTFEVGSEEAAGKYKNCLKILPPHPKAVFLVRLGTSSFPARHEVYGKAGENFLLSSEQTRTQVSLV